MKLIVYEWKKLLMQRWIWFLTLLLLVGNLLVLHVEQKGTPAYFFVHQQKANYTAFCQGNKNADTMGFYQQELTEQENYQTSYKQFIEQMEGRAEKIRESSLYENVNGYLLRNLYKTCQDFSTFSDTIISLDNCFGLCAYAQYDYGIMFLIIFLALLTWYILFYERNRSLLLLFKSCQCGHQSLAIAKLITMLMSGVIYALMQETSTVLYLGWMYGYGDLARPIQSVAVFRNCCYQLTLGQALGVNIAIRIAITLLIGTAMFAIGVWVKSEIGAIITIGIALGGEYVLYRLIYLTGTIRALKIVNPFYYWSMKQSLGYYLNLNCLEYAVNKDFVMLVCATFLIVLFSTLGIIIFHRTCQIRSDGHWEHCIEWFRRKWGAINHQTSLLYFEFYKLLIQQKKGIVVLFLLIWAAYSTLGVYDTQYYASSKEAAYHAYLVDLAGPITNEKLDYIENEEMRLQQLKEEISSCKDTTDIGTINKQMLQLELECWEEGFQQVQMQVGALAEKTGSLSDKYFIDEISYLKLWQSTDNEVFLWFAGSVILLFLLTGIYAVDEENEVWRLCRTTRMGRKPLEHTKDRVLLFCSIAVYLATEMPLFLSYVKIDGFVAARHQLRNLVNWNCSSSITLFVFEGIVFFLKGLSFILVALVGRKLAQILKQRTLVLLVGSGVFGIVALIFVRFGWSIHMLVLQLL